MYRIIKIGMDVHSKNYTLCAIEPVIGEKDRIFATIQVTADYATVMRANSKPVLILGYNDFSMATILSGKRDKMKKTYLIFVFILTFVFLYGCKEKVKEQQLYFAPYQRQTVCFLKENLTFILNGNLYYVYMDNKDIALSLVESESLEVMRGSWLYSNEIQDSAYIVEPMTNMLLNVHVLSKNYEINQTYVVRDELMDSYSPAVVSNDICYYVKGVAEGVGGFGRTLKKFDLKNSEERDTLYVWANGGNYDGLSGMHIYDHYLVMTYRGDETKTLWVYDTNKKEMIISENQNMSDAAYLKEKLYYIDEEDGQIHIYDLKQQKILEGTFSVQNYRPGMTIACDNDYIYVNQSTADDAWENPEKNTKIWIYLLEGQVNRKHRVFFILTNLK